MRALEQLEAAARTAFEMATGAPDVREVEVFAASSCSSARTQWLGVAVMFLPSTG